MSHICPTLARLCGGRRTISIGDDLYHVLADLAEGATSHVVLVRKRKDELLIWDMRSLAFSKDKHPYGHILFKLHELYALKLICMSREKASSIDNEIKAHKRVQGDPLVLELLASEVIKSASNSDVLEARLLFPYCRGGTLHAALENSRSSGGFSEDQALHIFQQMAAAVAHCHARGVVHRDIKLTNVYLRTRGGTEWVLADYGSCVLTAEPRNVASPESAAFASCVRTRWAEKMKINDRVTLMHAREEVEELTTPEYRAPEQVALELGSELSSMVDVWALGVALHQLVLGANPFATPLATLSPRAVSDAERLLRPQTQALISAMLQREPASRLSAQKAAEMARAARTASSQVSSTSSKREEENWAAFDQV